MADIITIDDATDLPEPPPGGNKGLIPRDFAAYPQGYMCAAAGDRVFDLPLMTDDEIEATIKRQAEEQSSPKDVFFRLGMEALDQNGQGYCWGYSTTSGIMLGTGMSLGVYERLSGHMIGCLVKNYRDQGGWNAQSIQFAQENGVAPTSGPGAWPEKSMSRSNDTPEMRAAAKKRIILEAMDLDDGGERLKRQCATCLCNNIVYPSDHNWWGHSVLAGKIRKWGPNGRDFEIEILNSWTKTWSDRGWGVLAGPKAIPNGAIAIRVVRPAA